MASGTGVEFRPLDFIRYVMEHDQGLTTAEKAFLVAAAIGCDNPTFKVRRSVSGLAKRAKCSRDTASEMIDRPQVARYFAKVERPHARRLDIWLRQEPAPHAPEPDMSNARGEQHALEPDMLPASQGEQHALEPDMSSDHRESHALQPDMTCPSTRHDMPLNPTPSALPLQGSANTGDQVNGDPWAEAEADPLPAPRPAAPEADPLADVDWSQMPPFDDDEDQDQPADRPATETGNGESDGDGYDDMPRSYAERERRRQERLAAKAATAESLRQRGSRFAA